VDARIASDRKTAKEKIGKRLKRSVREPQEVNIMRETAKATEAVEQKMSRNNDKTLRKIRLMS